MVQITVYNTLSIKTTEVDFGIKKISQFELVQCKGNPLSSILLQRGMSDEDCIIGRKNLISRHLSTTQCNIPNIMSLTREAQFNHVYGKHLLLPIRKITRKNNPFAQRPQNTVQANVHRRCIGMFCRIRYCPIALLLMNGRMFALRCHHHLRRRRHN